MVRNTRLHVRSKLLLEQIVFNYRLVSATADVCGRGLNWKNKCRPAVWALSFPILIPFPLFRSLPVLSILFRNCLRKEVAVCSL